MVVHLHAHLKTASRMDFGHYKAYLYFTVKKNSEILALFTGEC